MSDFNCEDILALNSLLNPNPNLNDDLSEQIYSSKAQSTLNPGNVTGNRKKDQVAEPFAKIEAKFNGRKIEKNTKNDIWDENEFIEENIKEDGRPQPKFEVLYKQCVSSEDIYLGLSGKDVSSNSCDQLLVKVWLPDTNLKEIGVEVKEQSIHLQTPNYLLNHILPYKVNKDKSDAKWDKEKGLLLITLRVIKPEIWDQLNNGNDS